MSTKALAIQNSQRFAYDMLKAPMMDKNKNTFQVDEKNITVPAVLIQEQQLVNTQQNYTFDFSSNAPAATGALNNQVLPKTSVAVIYGFQMLLGYGATVNRRQYQAYGSGLDDNVIYNGTTNVQFEQSTFVNQIDNLGYRKVDGVNFDQWDGLILVQPLRVLTGELGTNKIIINLPSVSGLVFSANLFISFRVHIALGNAKA